MFLDARELPDGAEFRADICVAGAGAAGITIARDLAATGLDVLVVEAGGFEPERETQALYEGSNVGLPYSGLEQCRLRYFGGTTNHWSGWCMPLSADDLSEWPISAEELEPWYREAQRTCQLGAFEYDPGTIAQRQGVSILPLDARQARTVLYQYSPPARFGQLYRDDLQSAHRVQVVLNANLVGIDVDPSGRVDGLQCATLGGKRLSVRAGRNVLALGGIENARMLLAAASGGLGDGATHLGHFFMEHPHYYESAYLALRPDLDLRMYRRREAVTLDGEDSVERTIEVQGALSISADVRRREGLPTFACTILRVPEDRLTDLRAVGTDPSGLEATVGSDVPLRLFTLEARCEQRPLRGSRVFLTNERDPLGLRRVALDWRIADDARAGLRRGLEHLGSALARAGLGRLWLPLDPTGEWSPGEPRGGCHHMGTTRMAVSPSTGVVDPDGRVFGVENLYVAGSSVFPTVGCANPTLTIVALAHRLASHLAGHS